MNIIAVDDERPALYALEEAIREAMPDAALACFLRADEVLNYAKNTKIDVALLDINMSGMNGLALAKRLKDVYGKTNILFVTGFGEYAVDAFCLGASGYIMKPVEPEKITIEINRLRDPVQQNCDKRVRVQCFGNFAVFVDDKPLLFTRSKAKELLAFLVYKNGASISNAEIATILWEDKPYDSSLQSQTRKARAHLMQILKDAGIQHIVHRGFNSLAIAVENISCDYYNFMKGDAVALNTYTGEFMSEYSWAEFIIAFIENKIK